MLNTIRNYTSLGYKVTFERGATHHLEVGLMKNGKLITQQFKDDHATEEYVKEVFEHIHAKFKPQKKH